MSKEKENRGIIRYNSGEYSNGVDLNKTKIPGRNITIPGGEIYSPIDQGNKKGKNNTTVRITIPKGEVRRMADIPKKTLMKKLMESHPKLMKIRY